MTKYFWCKH